MTDTQVSFQNVSFQYASSFEETIHDLSFSVEAGEFVSFLAPSGAGKSTIFRLLTSLETPQSGTIFFNGSLLSNKSNQIGYMPQRDLLLDWRTILDNAALPLELQGFSKKHARKKALSYFADFGLEGYEHSYPVQLSGGMRQRVSFLRAMLSGQQVLLLDEPFSALDAMTRIAMQQWLLSMWKKWHMTILFVTHDIDEALLLSDRIFLFQQKPLSSYQEIRLTDTRPRLIKDDLFELKQSIVDKLLKKVSL
ncbi:ABC transporter ATP-binding protein [Alkalihalobacillus alcalophilus ATCC 27647 = CGMCC 1.3604]|uniref:ABC transporter ATP-binding protein n=1 Tax=Alkalihalobacillus alcalophilus ATCC 27647 = CGMCC 1.3604 TaxID=1218173 RepID=J8TG42_ALKAL|nr:ABC transporter ATP-binding protein [Alkalihalobacillus alcalophilus]AFV25926.1 nitrate/sulfonate/taurine transporter [Alkalihalobacillus alcalophilus ATCC 27647 = CGMCC 1.3604]KGA98488.1 nitrate ABC transporter ATP-binding protein [Alkalihalobacillus alcalophilus ATCC 27647 = CGMCC 1.3604]MED1562920.1 ABC transporter ATP-binding protein [Alkalihalobacillus alcalophilus]THG91734.1 ABC transporter ATP-binding protein [Alkalihalobacillus alcalophilus ATCC 27647 = CGMCC 1.3604]